MTGIKRHLLALLLLPAMLHPVGMAQDIDRLTMRNLKNIASALLRYDKTELADLIAYPYEREYPLRSIWTPDEMVGFLDSIFTPQVRAQLAKPSNQHWEPLGWRGYMMMDGMIWSDGEKITRINFPPQNELDKLLAARKADLAQLHPSLRSGWIPHMMLHLANNQFGYDRARIDLSDKDDGTCRIMFYKKGASLSQLPSLNMRGEHTIEGTMRLNYYIFRDRQREVRYSEGEGLSITPSDGTSPIYIQSIEN